MPNRCYVLGAGFSKPCRLPLASQLTARVMKHQRDLLSMFDPLGILPARLELLRHLFPSCKLDYEVEESWPDFEALVTVLDEWDDYRRACGGSEEFVSHFRKNLVETLNMLLCEQTEAAQREGKLGIIRDFLRKVHDEQSTIISFNWDLLLEVAAQDIGLGITYKKQHAKDAICVAKPHGSLNLAQVERTKWDDWQDPAKRPINIVRLHAEWEEQHDSVVIRADDPNNSLNRIVSALGPIVIAPTARKTYQLPWINWQWHLALDLVRNAAEVIIIGYSLPFADVRPRLLLQFARYQRDTLIPIKLIDPKADTLRDHFLGVVGSPLEIISQPWECVALGL